MRNEPSRFILPLLLLLFAPLVAWGQKITIYPPVLYAGLNEVTITAENGLASVRTQRGGNWGGIITGTNNALYRIISAPIFTRCARSAKMIIYVKGIAPDFSIPLRVEDCKGRSRETSIGLSEVWRVYYEDFGQVLLGATACHTFRVDATTGTDFIVEAVVSPSPLFQIRYKGNGRPPTPIPRSGTYLYDVCFKGTQGGRIKMPILVYLRRRYPAGGHNTFIVADTASVNVVAPTRRPTPRPTPRPIPRPVPRPTPRPVPRPVPRPTPRPVPPPPPPPPPPRPRVLAAIPRVLPIETVYEARVATPGNRIAEGSAEAQLVDPTTHRVVVMPTARSVDSGKIFVANYDVAGFLWGFGLSDRVTLLGGFAYIPSLISYNLVVTAGGRYEFLRQDYLRIAIGGEFNYSRSDASSIILGAPYLVTSIGDDDQRASLALGYSWRHHTPVDSTITPFNRQGGVVALGGDYRVAHHWKIAAEVYLLEEANYQPLVATLRYFDENFAIDAGVVIDLAVIGPKRDGVRVAPVASVMWVW